MAYLFALILLCWFLAWFFLFRKRRDTLQNMFDAQAAMESAQSPEEKKAAAKQVLAIIDEEELAGVVVDDARASAVKVLRYS